MDPWGWIQVLLSIAVLASAFLFTAQSRSPTSGMIQFLALVALFAFTLANYRPEQRKIFTRAARGIGLLCLLVAFILLFLT
jgi:hypothetical protein